jgi:hypothetical protein
LLLADGKNVRERLSWVRHIPAVVGQLNAMKVTGTNLRRDEITEDNHMQILAQRHGVKDPSTLNNTAVLRGFSARMSRRLFKYAKNQRVLLLRAVNYREKPPGGHFFKPSVHGSFGKQIFTVKEQVLRSGGALIFNVCYR